MESDTNTNEFYRRCKLCQSDKLKFIYSSQRSCLFIVKCLTCGLVFVDNIFSPSEQQAFYNIQVNYKEFAEAERSSPGVDDRHLEWLDEIKHQIDNMDGSLNNLERKPRMLDIGCGVGDFLVCAERQGFEIYGLEISASAAQLAAEWNGIHVDIREVADDPRTGFFEVITLIGVIEHVLDPNNILLHAHRLLASGGTIFIYTPVWGFYDAMTSFIARVSGGWFTKFIDRRINQAHLQIFSKITLINLLHQLGMETLASKVICEYNLPVKDYLQSLGITHPLIQSLVEKLVKTLIDRKLFFRNNMWVIARKL